MTWCVILSMLILWTTEAKIGFKKSLEMDVEFPALIRRDAGLPAGHLRPLGHHRPAESKVVELQHFPDRRIFHHGYSEQRTPVVFRNALNDTDVFRDWASDKYLKDTFGKLNLTIITQRPIFHRDEIKRTTQLMKFKKFLQEYEYDDWYVSSVIPVEMQQHLMLPKVLSCGVTSRYLQRPEMWMSSGSTASKLHSHYDHNLHCILFGRRDYVVIENRYKSNFQWQETYRNSGEGYSNIDMENINMFKHKRVQDTPWTWATLTQGDCILVPSGFLHYVHAYGRSISYNILISPASDIDENVFDPPCTTDAPKKMSDAKFTWTYENGKLRLTDQKLVPLTMRRHLFSLIGDESEMYFERFESFYNTSMSTKEEFPPAQEVFNILKENVVKPEKRENKGRGLNYVTRVDLHHLKQDQFERLAEIFNNPAKYMSKKEHSSHEEL